MRIYKCANGTEYIYFTSMSYDVDEIIELLEQHRGKTLYSGALEHPCMEITDECLQIEELDFFTLDCPDEKAQRLGDDLFEFFRNEDGEIAHEKDRYITKDEEGDE